MSLQYRLKLSIQPTSDDPVIKFSPLFGKFIHAYAVHFLAGNTPIYRSFNCKVPLREEKETTLNTYSKKILLKTGFVHKQFVNLSFKVSGP